jgi:addiction module HigA family antidote
MKPLGLTIIAVAEALGITRKHIAAIVNERAPVTPAMALRLAEAFSNRAEFWLNLQTQHDLWIEGKKARPKIKPLKAAA